MIFDIENIFLVGASITLFDLIMSKVHRAYPNIKKLSDLHENGIVEYTIPTSDKTTNYLHMIQSNYTQLFSPKIKINGIVQVGHLRYPKPNIVYTLNNLIPELNIDNHTLIDLNDTRILTYHQASRIEEFEYIPDKRNYSLGNRYLLITPPNEEIYITNYQVGEKIYLHIDGQKNCLQISRHIHTITNRIYRKRTDCYGVYIIGFVGFYFLFKDAHDHMKKR